MLGLQVVRVGSHGHGDSDVGLGFESTGTSLTGCGTNLDHRDGELSVEVSHGPILMRVRTGTPKADDETRRAGRVTLKVGHLCHSELLAVAGQVGTRDSDRLCPPERRNQRPRGESASRSRPPKEEIKGPVPVESQRHGHDSLPEATSPLNFQELEHSWLNTEQSRSVTRLYAPQPEASLHTAMQGLMRRQAPKGGLLKATWAPGGPGTGVSRGGEERRPRPTLVRVHISWYCGRGCSLRLPHAAIQRS